MAKEVAQVVNRCNDAKSNGFLGNGIVLESNVDCVSESIRV